MWNTSVRNFFVVILNLASIILSSAHEDPKTLVSSLTHDIDHILLGEDLSSLDANKKNKLADLYLSRARELLILGERKQSYVDLIKYTEILPNIYTGWNELARIEQDPTKRAKYLEKALKLASLNDEKSEVYQALAEHSYTAENFQKALFYCERSLSLVKGEKMSKILFKNHLLWRLRNFDERVRFLTKELKANSSEVLRQALIDAQIDAGEGEKVKQIIYKEIAEARFRSSWLIRAARCEKRGSEQSKQYAQFAIDEILQRLHPDRPDITLKMDLVQAYALLQDKKAQEYLDQIPDVEYTRWRKAELTFTLK